MQAPDCRDLSLQSDWYVGQGGQEDKDGKDDKKFGHTRGAKLVSHDARITDMANKTEDKTEHICG